MKLARLEHVNVTVKDPDATAARLVDLFGWTIRWSGDSKYGGRTVHVGEDGTYLALYALPRATPMEGDTYGKHLALNHVGIEVDDLDAAEERVLRAGLETYSHQEYEPGRRFYFRVDDGLEFELLSYA